MRLTAVPEERFCAASKAHASSCAGRYHVCYRCGFLLGRCHHKRLGSLLDY